MSVIQKQDAKTMAAVLQSLRLIPARAQKRSRQILVGWKEGAAALLTASTKGKLRGTAA